MHLKIPASCKTSQELADNVGYKYHNPYRSVYYQLFITRQTPLPVALAFSNVSILLFEAEVFLKNARSALFKQDRTVLADSLHCWIVHPSGSHSGESVICKQERKKPKWIETTTGFIFVIKGPKKPCKRSIISYRTKLIAWSFLHNLGSACSWPYPLLN